MQFKTAFREFITHAAVYESHSRRGGQIVASLCQELESFRRPPPTASSPLLSTLLSGRMEASQSLRVYVESGCRHAGEQAASAIKIDILFKNLHQHMEEVKETMDSLRSALAAAQAAARDSCERFGDEAVGLRAASTKAEAASVQDWDGRGEELSGPITTGTEVAYEVQLKMGEAADRRTWAEVRQNLYELDQISMMAAIASMLESDHLMKDKVVEALSLSTSSEQLRSYNLMWTLEPFISKDVISEGVQLLD